MTASLAYRTHAAAINAGAAPAKYTRIVPFVTGRSVVEIGAAEGVLALLLAERGHVVTAIEKSAERHAEALRLKDRWAAMGRNVASCAMVHGDARSAPVDGIETVVAVRSIYYLRADAVAVLDRFRDATRIVLCGNRNRACRWMAGAIPDDDGLGEWNRFASIDGMKDLLAAAGYRVSEVVEDGDPIVIGCR